MKLHLTLGMSSESSVALVEGKPWSVMTRRAIDTSGCVGSLYDGYRDQMLEKKHVKNNKLKVRNPKTVECILVSDTMAESQNLLQMIGIEDGLRLNILLNLVPRAGLAALIDYSYRINEYTRLLRYTYTYREECLPNDKAKKLIKSLMPRTDATHIITSVSWGIDVVVVLQLPTETDVVNAIDTILEKVRTDLAGNHGSKTFNTQELDKFSITDVKVYSNIPVLARVTSLDDIYQKIHQLKVNYTEHRPVHYTLHSIQEINGKDSDALCNNKVEQHFLQMTTSIKYLESYFSENKLSVLRQYFSEQLFDIYMRLLDVKKKYMEELERFSKLRIDWDRTRVHVPPIEVAFNDEQQTTLAKNIRELTENITNLEAKEQLINDLQQKQFQYRKVTKYDVDSTDNEQKIVQILIRDDRLDRILCSTDTLNNSKPSELDRLRDLLVQQRQNNANLRLVYADFSYCSFDLPDIIILPRDKVNETDSMENRYTSPPPIETQTLPSVPSSPSEDVVNILLLGESGVGKSTFINAFVNYLTFETLEEAESNKPVVLIPVSFLITVGNNFKERMVRFGDSDGTNNEDFDHPGQSVTQQCKSYVFNLNRISGKKLRIIDTPGFGDTRGLDQDDLNMQNILEYINNFTHLNAVCFLLKPNVARLNNYFRTCITQLLGLLGPNARQNIIFCFTNSRCTFYAPGNTAPLLRVLLDSFPVQDIPFTKTNTFCFDSESFRYLVALKNSIKFSELDKDEYKKSWTISAIESKRLIDYVCNNRTVYHLHNKWRSTQHAQIEIVQMIRPMVETMRNTLRNIILLKMKSKNTSIKLIPKDIGDPTTICLSCKSKFILIADFWITPNDLHGRPNKCLTCSCTPDQHISIDYTLRYEATSNPANHDEYEMIDQVSLLLNATVEFARFLKSIAYSSKNDLFLVHFTRMIQEEKQICAEKESEQLNLLLLDELEKLKNKYEYRMNEMKLNQSNIKLAVVYERIKITRNYPDVYEQMNAVKESQEKMMKYYEHEISNDLTNTLNHMSTAF